MTTKTTTGISGGNATIFVSDMQRAFAFYTETLGLAVKYRAGDEFAMLDAGNGFCIGLHPLSPSVPKAGTNGSVQIGLDVSRPMEDIVRDLQGRGVQFDEHNGNTIIDDDPVKLAFLRDPDGNIIYLCESKH